MKKILQVVGCLELGGTEAFIMNHYRNINRDEFQFDFLVLIEKKYPYAQEIETLGGRIFFVGTPTIKNFSNFYQNMKKVVEENGPYDVIHSHINIANSAVLYAAKKLKIPVRISHCHDTAGKEGSFLVRTYRKMQIRVIKKAATRFLACSSLAGQYLYGAQFFDKYGCVMHNGINVNAVQKIDLKEVKNLKERWGISDDCRLLVGNITRFEEKKNSFFTVEVFAEILKKEPSAILVMGGPDGGLLEAVTKRIKELGIEESVRLIGARNDIPLWLHLLDAYIFPSRFEGLGIAMLEAQAAGCECFASTNVPVECDMGIGNMHFYALEAQPISWATKILEVMKNRRRYAEEEIKSIFFKKGYDISNSVERLKEIYNGK